MSLTRLRLSRALLDLLTDEQIQHLQSVGIDVTAPIASLSSTGLTRQTYAAQVGGSGSEPNFDSVTLVRNLLGSYSYQLPH